MNQKEIKIGTHGEQYGNWMSKPVFYMLGGGIAVAAVLTALSFAVFHLPILGIIFAVITAALVAAACWCAWIRRQYSFGGGGMMDKVHQSLLSHLDFDGNGTLLEVGCGSGALTIRAALSWPECKAVGVMYAGLLSGSADISAGGALALALGIAIQNVPEGAIISMPLHAEGKSKPFAFFGGVISGTVEPIGALLTILISALMVPVMPYMLSFAAGAMIYVVVEELIPEMSQGEHSNVGVIMFALGFTVMMVLDVALG